MRDPLWLSILATLLKITQILMQDMVRIRRTKRTPHSTEKTPRDGYVFI